MPEVNFDWVKGQMQEARLRLVLEPPYLSYLKPGTR
jgi:hypothetical protein